MLKKNDAQDCLLALVYQLLHYFHWHVAHGQLLQYSTTMLALKEFTHRIRDTCNGKLHRFHNQIQIHNPGSRLEFLATKIRLARNPSPKYSSRNLFSEAERFISLSE